MSHPYSNAAGYIYANEYEAPSDSRHWNIKDNVRPSAEIAHYESYSPFHPKRVELDPQGSDHDDRGNFGRSHVVPPGRKGYAARAMRPGMTSISTTTTKTSASFSPFSRVSSLTSRTTSNNSHDNHVHLPVKYNTPSKRVHAPYDPFAYHPGVYDSQDFMHTKDPPEAKSKFSFKFKLTLPSAFRFRTGSRPRSPTSPGGLPPASSAITTTTTTAKSLPCPLYFPRGVTLYDDSDDDPSSSHWRWSSFEQRRPSSLSRWFSRTKSKTFTKSVAGSSSTYHTPLRNAHQERAGFHTKSSSSGNPHHDTMRGRPTKGSLRFAQDAVRDRLGPETGRRAGTDLNFSMVIPST